jgi:DNA-binding beta-propeller fold protein YncE/mono/diheme cytochrome c family protein
MHKARLGGSLIMIIVAAAAAACGGNAGGKDPKVASGAVVSARGATSCKGSSVAEPIGSSAGTNRQSSTLALAKVAGRRVAFVADEDAQAVVTMDLDTRTEIARTRLGGAPSQVYVARDGRVFTTVRDKSELVVLAASRADAPLTKLCGAATPTEPIAIAATPDEGQILVTSGWGQKLAVFDGATLAAKFEAKLPREPRSVVVSEDGKTAFVSHAVGSLVSTVDLGDAKHDAKSISVRGWGPGELRAVEQRKQVLAQLKKQDPLEEEAAGALDPATKRMMEGRPSCQGFVLAKSSAVPGRIFAPQVMVDPGDPERRPDGYGDEHSNTETPSVAVIDEGAAEPLASSVTINRDPTVFRKGRDARSEKPECLLPRAAAIDPKTKSLLVTCYGIDAVVAYDATAANPLSAERRRWTVGSGPSGVAIDVEKHRAVVFSQFDRTLATFPIGGSELVDEKVSPTVVQKAALAPLDQKMPAEFALGRILFHAAGDSRISNDGRACASCHPDGRDDAITWATPEGPRRSMLLAGRVSRTAPYSWNGNESTVHNHLGNTFDRLSGKGLRSIELDALVTYLSSMPPPPEQKAREQNKVERGKQIFASKETACSSCHSGPDFTDGKNHDVGSKHKADRGAAFNTPSLHLVGGTGPYFHDGRYTSLAELLRKSDGKMGRTRHLSEADLDALETYLRTL